MTPQLAAQLAAMVLTAVFAFLMVVFLTLVFERDPFERDDQAVPVVQENRFWALAPIPALCLPDPGHAPCTSWCVTDHRPAPMPAR